MRRVLSVGAVVVALLALSVSPAAADEVVGFARLRGANEVPPVATEGRGTATFTLNNDGTVLRFTLKLRKIDNLLFGHIHEAPPGVNGPIIFVLFENDGSLTGSNHVINGSFTDPEDIAAILDLFRSGNAYVNVHSEEFPSGEIRGQVRT